MALCCSGAPRRAAISGAVLFLLLALCGAVQGSSVVFVEGASALDARQGTVVASTGRALRQVDQIETDCSDCGCARVECATYCESASNIKDFTCDEAGWFSNGKWLCECLPTPSPTRNSNSGTPVYSAAPATSLGRLTLAIIGIACLLSYLAL